MFCPICGTTEVSETETGNGGELYVAEELDSCTECYASDIQLYQCASGHSFYVDKNQQVSASGLTS